MSSRQRRIKASGHGSRATVLPVDPITISATDKSIRVNVGLLEPPANVYDADVFWVERQPGFVSMYFGQRNPAEERRLRTRLHLKYAAPMFVATCRRNKAFLETTQKHLADWPVDPLLQAASDIRKWPADKDHSEWVNFDYMSRTNTQGSIDFYYMPAAAIAKYVTNHGTQDLKMHAIVRVLLTVFQLTELLEKCHQVLPDVIDTLPSQVLKEVETDDEEKADG